LVRTLDRLLDFGRSQGLPRFLEDFEKSCCREELERLHRNSNAALSALAGKVLESFEC